MARICGSPPCDGRGQQQGRVESMSYSANQRRTFLQLVALLRPIWRTEVNLPSRIQSLLASNRAFGSRDRRLYRELLYTTLRYLPWIEPLLDVDAEFAADAVAWLAASLPATQAYRANLLADWPPCPPATAEKFQTLRTMAEGRAIAPPVADGQVGAGLERLLPEALAIPLPSWFRTHCPAAFEATQIDALLARAPLWLRLQTEDTEEVWTEFRSRGWTWRESTELPNACELLAEADVTQTNAFQRGLIEIQDLGSQLVLEAVRPGAGGEWLDACAGAGGKTLQLAALLGPTARIDAHDVRPAALEELAMRARRAGITVQRSTGASSETAAAGPDHRHGTARIRILPQIPSGQLYDGVLVDAPCSGSGTWRRAPHLKWITTPEQIDGAATVQTKLLEQFAAHVRPGGLLVYATCSLSQVENGDVVAAFLARQSGFTLQPPARTFGFVTTNNLFTILPAQLNTDGFFVAVFRRD